MKWEMKNKLFCDDYNENKNINTHTTHTQYGGACGVTVIIIGNDYGCTSSNPGQCWLHFT